jgi:hypothetical protein
MKKILFAMAAMLSPFSGLFCQIAFDQTYTITSYQPSGGLFYTKFSNLGYKYCVSDPAQKKIHIYNVNHSLHMTINIPLPSNITSFRVLYLSDRLFDTNSNIEYLIDVYSTGQAPPKVYVFDQAGAQLFYKDSALITEPYSDDRYVSQTGIFYNGVSAKMRLQRYTISATTPSRYELYTLPGELPCNSCTSFTYTAPSNVGVRENSDQDGAMFYPNPASNWLKLKYTLPPASRSAEIRIYNSEGKLIETYLVDSAFESLLMPAEYNNGLYVYSLYVDGKRVKTEKIVLSK